jgi:hypothetical protein
LHTSNLCTLIDSLILQLFPHQKTTQTDAAKTFQDQVLGKIKTIRYAKIIFCSKKLQAVTRMDHGNSLEICITGCLCKLLVYGHIMEQMLEQNQRKLLI